MIIKESSDADKPAIFDVHLNAFDESEAESVARLAIDLLEDPAARPLLSLVAIIDERVIGHILFTPVSVEGADIQGGFILAPLAVLPEFQNQGVGKALIAQGMDLLKQQAAAFALVLQTNALTVKLSFVALILAVVYPFTKRFTYFPQLFLGAAFAWAIPMAFAAQSGELTRITWLAFLAAVLWAMAYDTIYAMVDRQDDLKVGIRSTAILFGEADVAIVGILHLLVLLAQLLIGFALQRGVWYFCALLVAGLLVIYQLWLIRKREPASCFRAFLNNNYLGIVLLSGTIMDYAMNPVSTAAT
jgi:4-hydroxybenzoate polyprenyl transferase